MKRLQQIVYVATFAAAIVATLAAVTPARSLAAPVSAMSSADVAPPSAPVPAPPSAPPSAGLAPPGALPARSAADSAVRPHSSRTPGMFSRILAEADSALKLRGGARADDAQLFLSWNAPWGERRAQRVRMPACADSMREDTLYLSFQAGRSSERFSGFTGSIYLRATGSDTLGSWWHTDSRTGENPGSLRMEWSSAEGFPGRNPWHAAGQGFLILTRTPQAAHLRMVFAVPYEEAGPVVPNAIYALGRIIFKHHPERALAGCAQPVVVEWGTATLAFGPKDEPAVSRGERFVTWGGPITLAEAFKSSKVVVWRPKQPAAK